MTYQGHLVTMLYDFDAYALYYRADLFSRRAIAVPTNWDRVHGGRQEDRRDEATASSVKYGFQVLPDTFHFSQFLFQSGGSILNADNTQAVFNSQAGVTALDYMKSFLDDGTGVYWGPDQGDSSGIAGIKDGRIAMFLNGPYMMGLLKTSAPEQNGKWKVAPAPYQQAARQLPGRHRPHDPGQRQEQDGRLGVRAVPAPAAAAARRLQVRRRRAGHDRRAQRSRS